MNGIRKNGDGGISGQAAFGSRLSHGVFTLLAIAGLLFAAANASAACGNMNGLGSASPIKLPMFASLVGNPSEFSGPNASIVGLWHVVYTANGETFNETLDQWHSDGTEFENAWLPPDAGNICFGVWKLVAARTVHLHHVGWTFTPGSAPGTATGTFTLDEVNVVARNGMTYTGTFTFKTFDLKGDPGMEVKGTIAATRITVE